MRALDLRPITLSVALLVVLCACGAGGDDLDGRTFTSTRVDGHTLVDGTAVMLTFGDGQVSASAGCNTMGGPATWADGTLAVSGELRTTLIGCPPDLQAQDDWLAGFLRAAPAVALDGRVLVLTDATTDITLQEDDGGG